MPRIPFDTLPDASRLWIFTSGRELSSDEEARLLRTVDEYLDGWQAHGVPLTCARDWRDGRFLLIAVDEASEPPSGCSIDAMVRVLKGEGERFGTTFLDHGPVRWRDEEGRVRSTSRPEFRRMAEAGEVDQDVLVFDNTLTRLEPLRRGEWERPARKSWHGRAFWG